MRTALIQLTSTRDIDANLATCRQFAEQAAETGADWILFPENAPFLGKDEDKIPLAESVDGPQVRFFQQLARDLSSWITLGSFAEKSPDPDRTSNTQVHIKPDGEIASLYRKIHLFDVAVDEQTTFRESDSVFPGDTIVDTYINDRLHRRQPIGLSICYDLRFPELYRTLQSRHVKAITVPSAFTLSTGRAHWHALLRARAIENQAYVLAPNQWGHHGGNRHSYGHSVIYDPWGHRIASASDRQGFIVADLDFDYVDEVRRRMPVFAHRTIDPPDL